jgi:hypothetical protein
MMRKILIGNFLFWLCLTTLVCHSQERLLKFPGQWEFLIPANYVILTSDQQLIDITDPDKKINMSVNVKPNLKSLKDIAKETVALGESTVIIAYDNFFAHYRGDKEAVRKLLPDSEEYIRLMKQISDYLGKYGLGLELSLINPIELGSSFVKKGAGPGRWVQFKTALRDSITGKFSADLWQQQFWTNNKGKFNIVLKDMKAFAFKEKLLEGGEYFGVNPDDIKEIKSDIKLEEYPGNTNHISKKVRVYTDKNEEFKGYDRVLVLLVYETPEMDYFDPQASAFMKGLLKQYFDAGIRINSFYSDEMHIQQDWFYSSHMDNGQFSYRFLTENMKKTYGAKYGSKYEDMDKYMLYFVNSPQTFSWSSGALIDRQYVMGNTPEDIHKTILFRDRYYKLLSNNVVDLCAGTKKYGEELFGHKMLAKGHATWAQSPTCDEWFAAQNQHSWKYEYTPNFIRSNTDHQASAACYDNFKWGDYFTGNGSDHPEGGYLDRDYYGAAFSASIGNTNDYNNAYSGHWGMPAGCSSRRNDIVTAYGDQGAVTTSFLNGRVHRETNVLILYPMNLVAANPRFGSWMTLYGYADYITSDKLMELGKVTADGHIQVKNRSYTTLVSLFDIVPDNEILKMMSDLSNNGGKVVWFGMPPMLRSDGSDCQKQWEQLFGVKYHHQTYFGNMSCGKKIIFSNAFKDIPEQVILTQFMVDRTFPVQIVNDNVEKTAYINNELLGTKNKNGKGDVYYFGFRPRDDQSASLGYETRTLFEILKTIGAYRSSGKFPGINDNTDVVSRTTRYLTTCFPNGNIVITPHYRDQPETWDGDWQRSPEKDSLALAENPVPSDSIHISDFKVDGHSVTYNGKGLLSFLFDKADVLIGFEGKNTNGITVDDQKYKFSDNNQRYIFFSPILPEQQLDRKAFYVIRLEGSGSVALPIRTQRTRLALFAEGPIIGSKGKQVPFTYKNNLLVIQLNREIQGKLLYLCGWQTEIGK